MNTQNKNRKSFRDALNILSTNGFKSVWNEEEYHLKFTTVKSEIPVTCVNCKDESLKSLFNINRGSKCKKCALPRKTRLLKYKTVNDEFIKNGMKLLWNDEEFTRNFTGCSQKIPVLCVCKERKELCYSSVRNGRKCQDCGNNRRKNYEDVLKIVEDNGMKLNMSKEQFDLIYKSMNDPITILCKCNKEYSVRINDVKFGYSCKECGKEKVRNTNLERYGVENPILNEEIKEKVRNTNLERYGVENSFLNEEIKEKIRNTNLERYGVENPFLNEEIKEKIRNTNLERYGVENPFLNEEIKEKIRNTNLERYGFEYSAQNEEIKQKIKNTNLEKYGVEYPFQSDEIQEKVKQSILDIYGVEFITQHPDVKEKTKNTNLDRYGVEYPAQNEDVRKKMQNTCISKFGVPFALQNEDIFKKTMTKMTSFKLFEYPSGNTIEIQGYEHFAIKELLENGISEEDIITGPDNVPEIWYIDSENKKRRHYVDIYIKSENKCIEVKSEWTLKLQEYCMSYKQNAAKEQGYDYEIWIYNHKGVKLRIE